MVIQRQKYNIIDMKTGQLDRSIYVDEKIYLDELERIFARCWLYIGHESLIPNPNDFLLSYMGEDPVIMTRDFKGNIHVFLNMCMHRGNRIVRADKGNAKSFMCAYHGWTFGNDGRLVSVPGLQEAYYGELPVERLGLVEARCSIYAGIVFACWDPEAPSLDGYLGDLRWFMDVVYNYRSAGLQVSGPIKWITPFNWKTPVDNASDYYHATITHMSSSLARARYGRRRSAVAPTQVTSNKGSTYFRPDAYHSSANGHGAVIFLRDHDVTNKLGDTRYGDAFTDLSRQEAETFYEKAFPEKEQRLGGFRARRVDASVRTIFPNVFIGHRISHPRGPRQTEIWSHTYMEKDATPNMVIDRRLSMLQQDNPAGTTEQDDMDNWRQMTDSAIGVAGRRYPQDLSMGLGRERTHPQLPGKLSERFHTEHNQRYYYLRWQEMMNASTWKEISVDPITHSMYEGTAEGPS